MVLIGRLEGIGFSLHSFVSVVRLSSDVVDAICGAGCLVASPSFVSTAVRWRATSLESTIILMDSKLVAMVVST